jgi:rubrerythrin
MNFNSIEEVLEYAIEKEKEAVEFYEDISRQEPFSGTREAFEDFAKEEKKHQVLLENFAENKKKVAEYQYKWIPDLKRSDYLVDMEYVKGMHFTDILRLAMKREEKALQLYNELAGKTDNDDFAKLFKLLAQEEAKHKRALETIYDDHMAEQGD